MENNLSYLCLKKAAVKDEVDDDFEPNEYENDLQRNNQYFQWTPESTKLLLELRFDTERHLQFENRTNQRKDLWEEIAAGMFREGGFSVTGDSCDLKYRNMLQTYKKNRHKELNGLSSANISWCYYEMFKNALQDEVDPTNGSEQYNDKSQNDSSVSSSNTKKRRLDIKTEYPEMIPPPICELRTPSARLSNKRLNRSLPNPANSNAHSTEPVCKVKPAPQFDDKKSLDSLNDGHSSSFPLTNNELEECRVFGETVGVQLSLIKTPETRALAELKIQEILYAAKISKLK